MVGGSAAIATTATATTITQSSQRAAINWTGFDVGSGQRVNFVQPGAASVTLNRVTGPDPSAIAGKLDANGAVIITNPSGVTFYKGAQVNAQSIVVSAPGISTANFMAGHMVFNQAANPNAQVANHGTITVAKAGLAALVAPSVANSGVINARMGQVVLAGAATDTLDMYGDGLVAIDVTGQVASAPIGPGGKPVKALVTNEGIIQADGGVVRLTATAADGVVQTLVRAGGRIQADTVGNRPGRIEISGTGGSVVVEGRLAADGLAAGATGGNIVLRGDGATTLTSRAHVTASGKAGGGTIAIGTTLARAKGSGAAPPGTSAQTTIAPGARVSADATASGNGGHIAVLSTQTTRAAGTLTARGGASGGNGGVVELSGAGGFSLSAAVDASAPKGSLGTIILDPYNLTITAAAASTVTPVSTDTTPTSPTNVPNIPLTAGNTAAGSTDTVTPAAIAGLVGNVRLQAVNNLTVASSLTLTGDAPVFLEIAGQSLTLEAGNNLTINPGVKVALTSGNVNVPGTVTLSAAASSITGFNPAGTLSVLGNVQTGGGAITLNAGTGGIVLGGTLNTLGSIIGGPQPTPIYGAVLVNTTGPLTQTGGAIVAGILSGTSASVSLPSTTNAIQTVGGNGAAYTVTGAAGDFALVNSLPLTIGDGSATPALSVQAGRTISLTADSLAITVSDGGGPTLSAPGGTLTVSPLTPGTGIEITGTRPATGVLSLTMNELSATAASTLQLGALSPTTGLPLAGAVTLGLAGETIDLGANGGYTSLALVASGAVTQGGELAVAKVSGQAGTLALTNENNFIGELGGFTTTAGDLSFHTGTALLVSGPVIANGGAGNVTLSSSGGLGSDMTLAANVTGANVSFDSSFGALNVSGNILQTGGVITATTLAANGNTVSLPGANSIGTLGTVTANTALTVTNAQGLMVGGPVSVAAGGATLTATGDLTLNGSVTAATTVSLNATGSIVEGAGGSLSATTLTGTAGAAATLTGGVAINNLDRFVSQTGLQLSNSGPLTVTGPVSDATQISLTSVGGLTVSANVTAPTISLTTANLAPIFDASAAAVRLLQVSSGSPGNILQTAGAITASTQLTLTAAGTITQTGATISTATLTGSAGGATTLQSAGNTVAAIGNFSSTEGFALTTSGPLSIAGTLTDTDNGVAATVVGYVINAGGQLSVTGAIDLSQANGNLSLQAGAAGISLEGNLTANTIGVVTPGALTQTGGGVTSGFLSGNSSSVSLPSGTNAIQQFAFGYTVTGAAGDFVLVDSVPLSVGNTDTVPPLSVQTGRTVSLTTDALTIVQSAGGGPAISAPNGSLVLSPFTAGLGMQVTSSAATPGLLSLSTAELASTAAATLQLGTLLSTGAPVAGAITLGKAGETIDLGANGGYTNLVLNAGGAVTQGGELAVATVSGQAGSLTLTNAANVVGTLAGFTTAAGDLAFHTGTGLLVSGPVVANGGLNNVTLSSSGGAGNDMVLAANITGGIVSLNSTDGPLAASGVIRQTAGVITAGSLQATGGAVSLPGANAIAALGNSSGSAGFTLNNAAPLSVTGAVTDGTQVSLTSAGALTVSGAVTAPATTLVATGATGSITQTAGSLSGSTTLSLSAGGAITQQGGLITAGTLTGSAGGAVSLATTSNLVATLGSFTSVGGFALFDGQPLAVTGAVFDTTSITLQSAGSMTLSGTVSAPVTTLVALASGTDPGALAQTAGSITASTRLALGAAGSIAQSGGAITAGALTATAGTTTILTGGTNAVGVLNSVASTAFALVDSESLTITGPVTTTAPAGTVALGITGNLAIDGSVVAPGQLILTVSGSVAQTAPISIGSLTGQAGSLALTNPGNGVAAAGPLTTTAGGFALTDNAPLSIAGAVSVPQGQTLAITADAASFAAAGSLNAPGGTVQLAALSPAGLTVGGGAGLGGNPAVNAATLVLGTATGGPITVAGAFNLANVPVLDIHSAGAIAETGAGAVNVATLTGAGASAALNGPNQLGTLGTFTTTGAFALTNTPTLTVAGPVLASSASFVTSGLVVQGAITAPTQLALAVSGGVAEIGGSIATGLLTGSAGSAGLANPQNAVTAVGPFTSPGGFSLTNATGLTVAGALNGGSSVGLTVPGNLALNSGVSGGVVGLFATGAITEGAGGAVAATTLTGQASSAHLPNANLVAALGTFTTTSGLLLNNAEAIAVTGAVSDAASVTLQSAGSMTLSGMVSAPTTTLVALAARTDPGAIVQTAGSITGSTQLALGAAGSIAQSGGTITAAALTATAGTTISLTSAANAVGALNSVASTAFALTDSTGLIVNGPVTTTATAGTVTLGVTGNLAIDGAIAAPAQLVLDVTGAVTQTAAIDVGSLTGQAGSLALANTGNNLAAVGPFTATAGGFALTDSTPLQIPGAVAVPQGQTLAITADAPSFAAAGSLNAPGGTVQLAALSPAGLTVGGGAGIGGNPAVTASTLVLGTPPGGPVTVAGAFNLANVAMLDIQSAGAISETGLGAVAVGTLTGAGASATLNGPNQVGMIGAFTASTGNFAFTNTQSLTVANPVSAASVALDVTGALSLTGAVTAPAQLALVVSGAVTENGGTVATGLLTGNAGPVALNNPQNAVQAVGRFTSTGNFGLADSGNLAVSGALGAGNAALTVAGNLALNGGVSGGNVGLVAGGAVTEGAGGAVAATTLTGRANSATLSNSNAVAALGNFTTTAGLALNNAQAVAVTGAVSDTTAIALQSAGSMTLSGTVSAPAASLVATAAGRDPGAITEQGGTITAATLTGGSAGVTSLASSGNRVTALGSYSSTGGFTLTNGRALTVNGPLSDPTAVTLGVSGDLTLAGTIATGALTVNATGAVTQPGGSLVVTGALSATSVGSAQLNQIGNAIASLAGFTSLGDVSLTDSAPLTVAGNLVGSSAALDVTGQLSIGSKIMAPTQLTLAVSGAISQTGGTVTTGALSGAAGGAASLTSAGNSVGTLASFGSGGNLALTDSGPLTITGPVQAPDFVLVATGQMTLQGGSLVTNGLPLTQQSGAAAAVPGSFLRVLANAGGTASFVQTGTSTVVPLSGATATLRINLPATGGTLTFADLEGPATNLVLSLGSGAATGKLNVLSLLVLGSGGQAGFTGSVAGQSNYNAAELAAISPRSDTRYQLNGCAIQATSCIISQSTLVSPSLLEAALASEVSSASVLRPDILTLSVLDLSVTRDRDDPTLLLPNISDRDY